MDRPFSYDSEKSIFKYSNIQKRAEMRKFIPRLRKIADKVPFRLYSLKIHISRNDGVDVIFNENFPYTEDKLPQHSWTFRENEIDVKKIDEDGNRLMERIYTTDSNQSENLKKFLENYLDRKGTKITVADFEMFPSNVELRENMQFRGVSVDDDFEDYNVFEKINSPIKYLELPRLSSEVVAFESIRSAKEIYVINVIRNQEELDCALNLQAKKIEFDRVDVPDSGIISFLKTFAEKDLPIKAKVKIMGEKPDFERILTAIRNEDNRRWRNIYYKGRESVTLTKDDKEVNIYIKRGYLYLKYMKLGEAKLNGPSVPRMPRQLAQFVYNQLPYQSREKLRYAVNKHLNYDTAPIRAEALLVKYENGKLTEATVDSYETDNLETFEAFIRHGCYVGKLEIHGIPDCDDISFLNTPHLILQSNEPFPRDFANLFSFGVPDTVTATSKETIKNIHELTNQCNVVFMNEETGEPSVKRARTSD